MSGNQTLLQIEKNWEKKDSLWLIPHDFSSLQKKLVREAQERTAHLQGVVWFSSSGSTSQGGIKFFGHTRDSLCISARAVNEHLGVGSQDRILNPLPLYHVGGFGTWLRARLSGARWIDASLVKWSPKRFYELLVKERITVTSLVPTQVHDLVALQLKAPSHLRAVVVGGGALAHDLYVPARRLGWPLLPSYGMTEFGSQIATADLESLDHTSSGVKEIRFPQVKVLSHIKRIHQDERGTFIQSEAACLYQLEVRPDHRFSLELKKRSWGVLVDDRLEYDSKTRVIRVLGRKTRVVKIKGELVSLDEVQKELQTVKPSGSWRGQWSSQRKTTGKEAKIALSGDFLVISSPHVRDENELILIVESKESYRDWLSLVNSYNTQKPSHKQISRVEFVDTFPRTALGKVRISEVRSAFAEVCRTADG